MSSGYFPLDRKFDPHGKRLAACLDDLKKIISDLEDPFSGCDYAGLCAEDALRDGRYFERLDRAAEWIEGCLTEEQLTISDPRPKDPSHD